MSPEWMIGYHREADVVIVDVAHVGCWNSTSKLFGEGRLLYNHTGNCNIDWIYNGRNESVPIADTEKQQ